MSPKEQAKQQFTPPEGAPQNRTVRGARGHPVGLPLGQTRYLKRQRHLLVAGVCDPPVPSGDTSQARVAMSQLYADPPSTRGRSGSGPAVH